MRNYSPSYIGILASGLRGFSRVLQAISGDTVTLEQKLLAINADCLSWLVWSKTEDAEHNRNRPNSIFEVITGKEITEKENASFRTVEEFEEARARILEGK